MKDDFPEAPAIAYTGIKTKNGYHWSFTMRTKTVGELIDQMERMEEVFKGKGWEAEEIRSSGFKKKEVEYVEGKKCLKCGGRLVAKVSLKTNKKFNKCENNKWDPVNQKATGCDYIEWIEPQLPPYDKKDPYKNGGIPVNEYENY